MVLKTRVRYTAHLVFMNWSLLSQTSFPSLPKALEAFDSHVSGSTFSILL